MRHYAFIVALTLHLSTLTVLAHPPSGLVIDDKGKVYFADGADGVFRIDNDGKLTRINKSAMHWLAIDHAGKFADAPDEFGEWFGRLTPKGEKPALISCSDFPCTIGTDGNLYFAKMHGLTIVRRTPDGKESNLATPDKFGIKLDSPAGVNGIAAAPDGSIHLVSLESVNKDKGSGEHILWRITMDGAVTQVARNFVKDPLPQDQAYRDARPQYTRGLAVDAEGNAFIAVTGNRRVIKLSPNGESRVVLQAQKPWSPTGVELFNGEVYVLEYDDESPFEGRNWPLRVRKVAKDGGVSVLAQVRVTAKQ